MSQVATTMTRTAGLENNLQMAFGILIRPTITYTECQDNYQQSEVDENVGSHTPIARVPLRSSCRHHVEGIKL